MAELKSTTAIGGNIVWHGGNLRFDPQGDTILYDGYKIFTEHDTPLPGELGNGSTTSAFDKTESDARFAPIHSAGYLRKDGDTMSGKLTVSANDIEIQGSSPRLTLNDWSGTSATDWYVINDGGYLSFREGTTSTSRLSVYSNELKLLVDDLSIHSKTALRGYDAWLRINDQLDFTSGVYFGSSAVRTDNMFQVGSSGATFNVSSSSFTYKGDKVFHDTYHPNADKWTTARTLSLSGDATGSVSWDGSANATLSVSVLNDSHTHDTRYMIVGQGAGGADVLPRQDSRSVDYIPSDYGDGVEYHFKYNTTDGFTQGGGVYHRVMNFDAWNGTSGGVSTQLAFGDSGHIGTRVASGDTGWQQWRLIFTDNYHPNADKWTTARTLSLSGDATGSVSWDGSANATLSVSVLNDSHTHDGRYYTETESDARFAPINGAGYVAKSGDTMSGTLNTQGVNIDTNAGGTPLRIQRSVNSQTGQDDNVTVFCDDSNIFFVHNNDADGDSSGYVFQFMSSGSAVNLFEFSDAEIQYKGHNVFHDIYHPNADKWTTARTLTLTGDASGSVSIDGSENETLSVAVANDSHTHDTQYRRFKTLTPGANHYFRVASINGDDNHVQLIVSNTGDYGNNQLGTYFLSAGTRRGSYTLRVNELMPTASDTPTFYYRETSTNNVEIWAKCSDYNSPISAQIIGQDGSSLLMDSSTASAPSGLVAATIYSHSGVFTTRDYIVEEGTRLSSKYLGLSSNAVSASKWTTARTITLGGDASGSVSIDGAANKTLTVTVANDSHTHDGRYFTETEADARFAPINGAGYLPLTGGTVSGVVDILANVGSAPNYNSGQLELKNTDAGDVSLGFHREGHTASQLRHESNGLILSGTTATNAADFYCYGNVTAYSDIALKKDIEVISNPLEKLTQIRGITYTRTNDPENLYGRQTGVIAQEVQAVLPEAVAEGKEHLSVAYGNLSGLMIESIKELNETVKTLQNEVQELKKPWWKKLFRL